MIERSMVKSYLHYVVPATIAFTLTCIYSIVDGIFVGNIVGDTGLAGINVAYPLYALVLATGTGIGMGGAVISSIREGSGNREGARHATGHTILMLLLFSIPVTLLLLFFRTSPLCSFRRSRRNTQSSRFVSFRIIFSSTFTGNDCWLPSFNPQSRTCEIRHGGLGRFRCYQCNI